ncbi:MAG: SH3 domain-containing protein [Oligoflexales bacterium]
MKNLITLSFLAFWMVSPLYAGTVVVKKKKALVYSKPSKKSPVVQTLKKGDTLDSVEREGMYWQVKVKGAIAYISITKVTHKVSKEEDGLAGAIREAVKQGRDENDAGNNRQRSAVMGVRGLDESEETAFAGNVKPNLRHVYNMEDVVLSRKDIKKHENMVFAELEKRAK